MKNSGKELATVIQPNENKSQELAVESNSEAVAISAWQLVREMLPAQMESDEAFKARVVFLREIVDEVGTERFTEAVKQAIRISQYRSEVTIARIRAMCGLDVRPPETPAAAAWVLVTQVVTRFVRRDANGNAVLERRVTLDADRQAVVEQVPNIPDAVADAVLQMGGWGALQESFPNWWAQRFQLFKELYRP